MTYPQQGGYPQQPYPQQQPYQPEPRSGGNPATAIITVLFALACAAFEIVLLVNWLELIDGQFGSLPGELIVVLVIQAVATLLLVLGAILALLRKTAGAVLAIAGAIVALAGFFIEPLLADRPNLGRYLESVFEFGNSAATFRALVAIAAVLTLIFAVLPPTFKYLRGNRNDDFPQQQYPGSGGFPQQGYQANPNSGGFPQQQYPNSGGFPQQGGYPQQQQGGGHPQQQGW
ncbi:hypothetical protein [Kibdelosporangium aridum]|uniref:Uncharacterized protein n=1 Tax=Kibdelosporangium aridum TaxID=2030 RepID=A0A1W2F054_KIBAR|nr:hypothetical protein [Kibdelosporangium aridum]SMD15357.1 hypothetical protein SAMN05661093_05254 [Kibdelosporangium aridum]